jgi:aminobenzoyl-glutamate transport protein
MGEAMAGMGTYVVLAFFAGQAIAWFRQSNLATVIGIEGAEVVKSLGSAPVRCSSRWSVRRRS